MLLFSAIGVVMAFYTLGPVVGFAAGGFFLNFYVTLGGKLLYMTDYIHTYIQCAYIHTMYIQSYTMRQ